MLHYITTLKALHILKNTLHINVQLNLLTTKYVRQRTCYYLSSDVITTENINDSPKLFSSIWGCFPLLSKWGPLPAPTFPTPFTCVQILIILHNSSSNTSGFMKTTVILLLTVMVSSFYLIALSFSYYHE